MTQEEKERSIEIAEFMGLQWSEVFEKWIMNDEHRTHINVEDMKYVSEMNWTYPVCQKINKAIKIVSENDLIKLRSLFYKICECLSNTEDVSEIFLHVSDFCKEYNLIHNKG